MKSKSPSHTPQCPFVATHSVPVSYASFQVVLYQPFSILAAYENLLENFEKITMFKSYLQI